MSSLTNWSQIGREILFSATMQRLRNMEKKNPIPVGGALRYLEIAVLHPQKRSEMMGRAFLAIAMLASPICAGRRG